MEGKRYLTAENDGFAFLNPFCHPFFFGMMNGSQIFSHFDINTSRLSELTNFTVRNPRYAPTGTFAVSRELILRNSVDYYRNLITLLAGENEPVIGHYFERLWPEIFHSECSRGERYYCRFSSSFVQVNHVNYGNYGNGIGGGVETKHILRGNVAGVRGKNGGDRKYSNSNSSSSGGSAKSHFFSNSTKTFTPIDIDYHCH
jgi:hypothetical protein